MSDRRACRRHAPRLTLAWAEDPGRARHFLLDKLFPGVFSGDPKRAPEQPPPVEAIPGGEAFRPPRHTPKFQEMTPEERELLALQVNRTKKAAAMQDQIIAALERLYGKPFAEQFAQNTFRTEQFQLQLLGEEEAAVGYRKGLRTAYETELGRTPEQVAAEQAKREVTTQELMYDRFLKAARGESAFDPTLVASIKAGYEDLDARMRQRMPGGGWEQSSAGIEARTRLDESVMRALYTARQEEMARAGGAALSPGVATPRLLVTQDRIPASAAAVGGISPASTEAGVLRSTYGQPIPGALPLSNLLMQDRGMANQFALDIWRTQYGGALSAGLAGYTANQNLIRDYYNNFARARVARLQADNEFGQSLAGAGMAAI